MPQDLPPGWSRTPPPRPEPPPPAYGAPEAYRRRAVAALVVAVLGIGAFVAGVRAAVRRIPPDAEARAAARGDSARREQAVEAARRREAGGGGRRPAGADVPRLQ